MIEVSCPASRAAELPGLAKEINAAHAEVVKANESALEHGTRCGHLLLKAKENYRYQQKFSDWIAENCTDISQRTANDYMRLAKNRALISSGAAKSIREALELIPPTRPSRKKPPASTLSAVEPPAAIITGPASVKMTDLLRNTAPDEMFDDLVATWDDEQIKELTNRLAEHLISKGIGRAPPQPEQPMRRM
jgi:hypothetical protein